MGEVEPRRRPEVLVFEVGGRRYGLPAADVRELQRVVTIVPVPLGSTMIEGVINLRGAVVPVLDIRALLKVPAKEPELADQLVIVEAGGQRAALRVDRVVELTGLGEVDLEQAGGLLSAGEDVVGVAKLSDGLVLILSLRNLAASAGAVAGAGMPPDLGAAAPGGGPS